MKELEVKQKMEVLQQRHYVSVKTLGFKQDSNKL